MNSPVQQPDCRQFARQLADHLDAARAGQVPAHASMCAACGNRLKLALGLGGPLAKRPEFPPQLKHPDVLAAIHQKVIDASERSPIGQAIGAAMRVEAIGDRLPWPVQTLRVEILEHIQAAPHRQPDRNPPLVLVAGERRARFRRRLAPASAIAASIALLAVFGWRAGRSEGTNEDVRIVFVPVSELPAVMHPTAVLRQAVVR